MKVLKGTPKHLSNTGQLDSFTYLMLNLPFQCNYRCQKCFNLEEDNPRNPTGSLTLESRLSLIDEAQELGGRVVVFAGEGEPTLNRDIRTLILKTHDNGLIPIVYSNGSTLSKDVVEFYRENKAALVIAFDSLNEDKYSRMTGSKNQFQKTLDNIDRCIDGFDRPYDEHGLQVYSIAINTTVSNINVNEIENIKNHWGDKVYFICNPLARLGNATSHWIDLETNRANHQELISKLSESGGPLTLGSDGLCGYSAYGIGVNPNGDYITCAYTDQTDGLFGNVTRLNLKDAVERKHRLEMEHYKKTGAKPCLVRADTFPVYIEGLKKLPLLK